MNGRKLKQSEIIMLLLSLILVIGLSIPVFRDRANRIAESGEFRLTVEDARLDYSNPQIPDGSITSPLPRKNNETVVLATILVYCKGRTPNYWNVTGMRLRDIKLVDHRGREYKVRTSFGLNRFTAQEATARRHFAFDYLCIIPKSGVSAGIETIKATIVIERPEVKSLTVITSVPISASVNE